MVRNEKEVEYVRFLERLREDAIFAFSHPHAPKVLKVADIKQDPRFSIFTSHINEILDCVCKKLDVVPLLAQTLRGEMSVEELREHIVQAYVAQNARGIYDFENGGKYNAKV